MAVALSAGRWEERAFLVAEWNSFQRREGRGDHQGFKWYEERLVEVWKVRRVVRRERCRWNQASKENLVGREGGGKTVNSLRSGKRVGQSVRDQLGERGGGEVNGCESII